MNLLASGRLIAGRYRLEALLGEGGMGVVWRATDLELNRPVAMKFMTPAAGLHADALARFRQEAQALARVQAPHVVQVFEYGEELNAPYIVMELLSGEDLGQRLKRDGRLSPSEAVTIACQAAKALEVAHAVGVVHRDLKPGNVFLARVGGDEIVKLLDFGIAKLSGALLSDATQTHELLGVPHYMSPEHSKSPKYVDGRTDLWSLAVILYRALTGQRPFDGESVADLIYNIRFAPLRPPTQLEPAVPRGFDSFFERALARDPAQRFQTAQEFADAAREALSHVPRPVPPSRRWQLSLAVGLVAAVSVVAGGALAFGSATAPEPEAVPAAALPAAALPAAAPPAAAASAAALSTPTPDLALPLPPSAAVDLEPKPPAPTASASVSTALPAATARHVSVPRGTKPSLPASRPTPEKSGGPVRLQVDY